MSEKEYNIHINGWHDSLDFICLVKYLREYGFSLSAAKNAADRILDQDTVVLPFTSKESAKLFLNKLKNVGCSCLIKRKK